VNEPSPPERDEQDEHAAQLGMMVFLASEALLFAALFALYGAYRATYPAAFALGVAHATRTLGTINTAVLLTSSLAAAASVHALRVGRRARSLALLALTLLLGVGFLVIKLSEYAQHLREGITPSGQGRFFALHPAAGLPSFWTLYYVTTGLHAVHVVIGLTVLAWLWVRVARGRVTAERDYPLALGVTYWHLIDVVWIFVWPLYYLAGGR
jgi:cytochrome c oxidase subunit 3